MYTGCGAWKWCKYFVRSGLGRKKKEVREGEKGEYNRGYVQSLNAKLTIRHTVCACECVFAGVCFSGPSELQEFLQSHHSGEWRENTKDTLSHKSTSPPSLSVPLGKAILSSNTFSSLRCLSPARFPSLSVRLLFHSAIPTLSFCVCVLSALVSLLWANLCQC